MNSADLARFISKNDIDAEIMLLPSETPTVAAAAEALGVRPEQIVKSVLFLADGRPLLVIANGLTRIQRKRLADEVGLSRRKIKMAGAEDVLALSGYPIGAVPPFGHPQPLPTLLDDGVLAESEVYGGGGETNALMRVAVQVLQTVTASRVVSVAER